MCELLHTSRGHDPAYSQLLLYGNPPGGRRAEGLVQRAAPGVEAPSASCPRELNPKKSGLSPRNVWPPYVGVFHNCSKTGHRFEDRKRNSVADATSSSLIGRADHDKASRFYHCSFGIQRPRAT